MFNGAKCFSPFVMAVNFMLISECHQNHELEQEEKQNEYQTLLGSETSLCKIFIGIMFS